MFRLIGDNGSTIDWDLFEKELEESAEYRGDDDTEDEEDLDELQDYYVYMKGPSKEESPSYVPLGRSTEEEDSSEDESNDISSTDTMDITDDDIRDNAGLLYPENRVYRSLILEVFAPEQCIELEKICRTHSITNNQKGQIIKDRLTEWGKEFNTLGGGTNRLGLMMDGYVIKIACDADGKIDNKREFIYSLQLYPYVIKCYETTPDGLIAVFEYVEIFTIDDFYKNQTRMREILSDIARDFLIGDVGISSINYVNWGYRGEDPVILDFAYIYDVSFKTFKCTCSLDAMLGYDKDFNTLICPICGKRWTFKDIRKRISRKDQDAEIGDILKKGYVLSSSEQEKAVNPRFVHDLFEEVAKKILKIKKKRNKDTEAKKPKEDDVQLSMDEIIQNIRNKKWRL